MLYSQQIDIFCGLKNYKSNSETPETKLIKKKLKKIN